MGNGIDIDIDFSDNPQEWNVCFGLSDNPFRPERPYDSFQIQTLRIDIKPLTPHLRECQILHPDFYADVDNFPTSMDGFKKYIVNLGTAGLRSGAIIVVHGPVGCGKTSFANLCRLALSKKKETRSYDLDFSELLGRQTDYTSPFKFVKTKVITDLRSANVPLRTLALVLIENLAPEVMALANFENDQPFQFLSKIAQEIEPMASPLIFVTTASPEIHRAFTKRPRGSAVNGTSFELSEISGDEVLVYIKGRVKFFRITDNGNVYLDDYFPFDREGIHKCFEEMDRQGKATKGCLPFRMVNQLLADAIRAKKMDLMHKNPKPLSPHLSEQEIRRRLVRKDDLDSVISRRIQ